MQVIHGEVEEHICDVNSLIGQRDINFNDPEVVEYDIISDTILEKLMGVVQVASIGTSAVVVTYGYLFLLAKLGIGI